MTRTIRVPDPVYERIEREADKRDVARGAIVERWMDKADAFEKMEGRRR